MNTLDVIGFLEKSYPPDFALSWDNSGLQVGRFEFEVNHIGVALTLTPEVVDEAVQKNIQLIVTHHPLFFQPLKRIEFSSPAGRMLEKIIQNRMTVYSLHTNLDVSQKGVSDELAGIFGIKQRQVMEVTSRDSLYKLVVYVPRDDFEAFRIKMLESCVGHIGDYSQCSFSTPGEGTFMPEEGAHPYIGSTAELSRVEEFRFETIVRQRDCERAVADMKQYHPYEEVAYDLIRLSNQDEPVGLGRHGTVEPVLLSQWEFPVQGMLKGNTDPMKLIRSVGVCGGNGSKLIQRAINLGLDLFVSSEMGYHDELYAQENGLTLLDIGHYASEMPMMRRLAEMLHRQFPGLMVTTLG